MTLYDYEMSQHIEAQAYPFYALIMTAMRQADTNNLAKLKAEWPNVWDELYRRYHAPGGVIPEDANPPQIRFEVVKRSKGDE